MARLRAATEQAHARLHEAPMLAPLQTGGLDVRAYRAILIRFDRVFASAEVEVLLPLDPWFSARGFTWRSRRPALARDLADLDALPTVPAPAAAPAPPRLGLPADPATALGLLYVTEGSRLGGRTLARHLSRSLPPEAANATRFLGSTGDDIAAHWRSVGAFIDAQATDPTVIEAAEIAARRFFGVLNQWFAEAP